MIVSAMRGIKRITNKGGLQNPISQLRCSKPKQRHHRYVTFSSPHIKIPLGMYKSSQKKINDEISKKQLKNGPNIRVLMGDIREIGNPHAIKKGKDMKEIKICN